MHSLLVVRIDSKPQAVNRPAVILNRLVSSQLRFPFKLLLVVRIDSTVCATEALTVNFGALFALGSNRFDRLFYGSSADSVK